jgi:hypothetical protein
MFRHPIRTRTFSLTICLLGLSQPTTIIRTIKISRRKQGFSKKNLPKVPKKVHLQPRFPLLRLSSKISPKIKGSPILRVRSRFININQSLKVLSNLNTKRLSPSSHPQPSPQHPIRNNNRSHKRKSPTNSSSPRNSLNLRDPRDSSRQRVLSWLRVSMWKRTSRCTSAPKSVSSRSLRGKRSHLTLKSR